MTIPEHSIPQSVNGASENRELGNAEPERKIREMTATIELVSPDKAARWLEQAADNRSISGGHVDRIGRALTDREWRVSNQGIGLDYAGRVIDGQHRLKAIVGTGVAAYMVVVRGLDPDAIRAIDDTRKRTFSDDLRIERHEQYAERAAATGLIFRFERGAAKGLTLANSGVVQLNRIEQAAALDMYESNQDLRAIIKVGSRANKSFGIPGSSVAAAYYLALEYKDDVDGVSEYFEKLSTGYDISHGDPVDVLRSSIRQRKDQGAASAGNPMENLAATLYCLNKTLAGERITRLLWTAVKRQTPRSLLS